MCQISLSLMGAVTLTDNDAPIKFRTKKVKALLIYLAVERDTTHLREHLIELLWPGYEVKSGRVNLRQTLSLMRQLIPDDMDIDVPLLQTEGQRVTLHPDIEVCLDVHDLQQHLDEARHIQRQGESRVNPSFRQHLEDAVKLYRGPFLADFYLDDSNPYEAWAQQVREKLRHQVIDALATLATLFMEAQNYETARRYALRQLEIDELDERANRQLMEAMARAGRSAEALAHYERLGRMLREQYDMPPNQKTTSLAEAIRNDNLEQPAQDQLSIRGYTLGNVIAEGAFGAVYHATQEGVGREVAIKVIKPAYADEPEFVRRFELEAQTVAQLEHLHIVTLYDFWRDPTGAFLVMRWLRGGNLSDAIEPNGWDAPRAVKLMEQLCSALEFAHRHNVIHRDLKPANVLLDEAGNAFLGDFGIARQLLQPAGDLTRGDALIGSPAYISPEQVLSEPVSPQTDIYTLGMVFYEVLTGQKPFPGASVATLIYKHCHEALPLIHPHRPDLPAAVDDVIQKATAKAPADRYTSALQFAGAMRAALNVTTPLAESVAAPQIVEENPYRGLRAFQESDSDLFHGRQALIEELVSHWRPAIPTVATPSERFLAVVGPSGSGKSSVVRAGFLPQLRAGAVPNSDKWFFATMVPSANPFEELETALLPVAVDPPAELLAALQKDERGLIRTLKRILPVGPDGNRPELVLIIDQFEELFTLVPSAKLRRAFIDMLVAALNDPRSQLRLLITLRADFYDRPLQHPELGELLRQQTQVVLPLTAQELSAAIRRPASRAGVILEEGLTEAIIADVVDQPGALPLLQYALTELYEKRDGRRLTHEAYREMGGVLGALGRRADELFAQLPEPRQQLTEQLFLRLVTLGEGSEDTRRRVLVTELEQLGEPQPILDLFGTHRLLTFDRDPHTRLPTAEVAHEALLREWPRLRGWLEASRDDIRQQRRLARLAQEWQAASAENSFLLRGAQLEQFDTWHQTAAVALTPREIAYLEASQHVAAARQAETAAQARTRTNLRRGLIAALSLGLIVAAVLAFLANNQRLAALENETKAEANLVLAQANEAEAEANAAEADANAAQAEANAAEAETNLALAEDNAEQAQDNEQEALANLNRAESQRLAAEASNLILRGRSPEVAALLALQGLAIQYTPEADLALQRATAQTFPSRLLQTGGLNEINTITLSEDETILLTQLRTDPPVIQGWDLETGEMIWQTRGDLLLRHLSKSVQPAAMAIFFPAPEFDTVALLDLATGTVVHTFEDPLLDALPFLPFVDTTSDVSRMTLSFPDGTTILYDTQILAEIDRFSPDLGEEQQPIFSHLSPDGSRIAAIGRTEILVWDVATGADLVRLQQDENEFGWSGGFSPDNRFLVSEATQFNPAVQLWDLATGERVPVEPGHNLIWRFSHDSRLFATLAGFGAERVRVISLPDGRETQLFGHTSTVWDIDFSQDSRTLLSASTDSSVRLWDVETGQESRILSGHSNSTFNAVFAANDTIVLTGGRDEDIRIWNLEAGSGTDRLARLSGPESFFINHDGTLLLTAGNEGGSQLIDIASGQTIQTWSDLVVPTGSNWNGQVFSDQKETVFLTSPAEIGEQAIVEVDIYSGEILASFSAVGPDWYGLTHVPGTDEILVVHTDGVDLIDTISSQVKFSFDLPSEPASGRGKVVVTADGRYAAAVTIENGYQVTVFDLLENTELRSKEYPPGQVGIQALAISDSGRYVAYPTSTTAIVVEVETGDERFELQQHTQSILVVAFSPDERTLLTASVDGTGTLWNLEDGSILRRFEIDGSAIAFGQFSPDGDTVYLSIGSEMRSASIDINELIVSTCGRLLRDLTADERRIYGVGNQPTCSKFGPNSESPAPGTRSNPVGRAPATSLGMVLALAGMAALFKRSIAP